ncbi:hypothetical protein EIN_227650 [Entamoeba invadens IP1]|uniref:Uncharacterized protein n=1 Tax=Entamoeba invadens IP1 TaxID=370355 RepID=A0A0A1U2Q9_ENTIV|nr:hypothetical protein EIN_227650 [Entamoeba invadens IP1]ELP88342.1 hypothetical protein EIN_227650 [Entamoeba invadens IP1]|eukprot:XP_004255113.1 hypothetical protein EIN_227650 [Entamoeba invadens IP1]
MDVYLTQVPRRQKSLPQSQILQEKYIDSIIDEVELSSQQSLADQVGFLFTHTEYMTPHSIAKHLNISINEVQKCIREFYATPLRSSCISRSVIDDSSYVTENSDEKSEWLTLQNPVPQTGNDSFVSFKRCVEDLIENKTALSWKGVLSLSHDYNVSEYMKNAKVKTVDVQQTFRLVLPTKSEKEKGRDMMSRVEFVKPSRVFCTELVGYQEYLDKKKVTSVWVPNHPTYFKVGREYGESKVLGTIRADGGCVAPLAIVSSEKEKKKIFNGGQDVTLVVEEDGVLTREIVVQYLKDSMFGEGECDIVVLIVSDYFRRFKLEREDWSKNVKILYIEEALEDSFLPMSKMVNCLIEKYKRSLIKKKEVCSVEKWLGALRKTFTEMRVKDAFKSIGVVIDEEFCRFEDVEDEDSTELC